MDEEEFAEELKSLLRMAEDCKIGKDDVLAGLLGAAAMAPHVTATVKIALTAGFPREVLIDSVGKTYDYFKGLAEAEATVSRLQSGDPPKH